MQTSAVRSYRCSVCDFWYHDHGPSSTMGLHRRLMAAYGATTWADAAEIALARQGARVGDETSWAGQKCGDRSAGTGECQGVLVAERPRTQSVYAALLCWHHLYRWPEIRAAAFAAYTSARYELLMRIADHATPEWASR